jgi:hypothetical protein
MMGAWYRGHDRSQLPAGLHNALHVGQVLYCGLLTMLQALLREQFGAQQQELLAKIAALEAKVG